jgi:palmitoyltransferase
MPRPPRRVWFVRDLLGVACAVSTWVLVLGAARILLQELLLPSADVAYCVANGAFFHLLATLGLVSHVRTMLTDPGSVVPGDPPLPDALSICPCCSCVRPESTHHCRVCRRCIRKMDHHCPWVNNCVDEDNQKSFVLFTMYITLASLHLLLLLGLVVLRSHERGEWTWHTPCRRAAPSSSSS